MYSLTLQLVVLHVLSEFASPEHDIFYVKPNTSAICPHYYQSCLTLDQYASQQSEFFNTDSIFFFLDGNHSFNSSIIQLTNVSNVALQGMNNNSDAVATISCSTEVVFHCNNVSNLTIQGLNFVFAQNGISALKIYNSEAVLLFGLKFQSTWTLNSQISSARAISAVHSNIKSTTAGLLKILEDMVELYLCQQVVILLYLKVILLATKQSLLEVQFLQLIVQNCILSKQGLQVTLL